MFIYTNSLNESIHSNESLFNATYKSKHRLERTDSLEWIWLEHATAARR